MKKIKAVFFSATDTTRRMISYVAQSLASHLGLIYEEVDFTLPESRLEPLHFMQDELIVFGTPVYAGRIPNVLLKFLQSMRSEGSMAVAICLYGNRNFDDALIEMRDLLNDAGAKTIAAGAFVGEHSFSTILGQGRPDKKDFIVADKFIKGVLEKIHMIESGQISYSLLQVRGRNREDRIYYQPRDRNGIGIDIRKVKPRVNNDLCNNCKICVKVCPMGAICKDNVQNYIGICIKCGACIKKCPMHARYYDDPGYMYHKQELEDIYGSVRAEPVWFL